MPAVSRAAGISEKGGMPMRILVVEDEKRLASTLKDMLEQENYLVDLACDGEAGLDNAMSGIYDALVLDVMLPDMSGFEIVRHLRQEGVALPVLLLTARTDTADRVTGLDCGADYYLTKPFEREELLACLRALLRRQGDVVAEELHYGDVTLNLLNGGLSCGNRTVTLSAREFELMRLLLANRGNLIAKETLLVKVWGYEAEVEGNVVEVYLSFLRKKLRHIKSRVRIEAVRRMGYHLRQDTL